MPFMSGFDGKNFIGGKWRPAASARTFEQRNPARLHEVTGTFADSSAADVDAAIAAAFVQMVTDPHMCGLGGFGAATYAGPEGVRHLGFHARIQADGRKA